MECEKDRCGFCCAVNVWKFEVLAERGECGQDKHLPAFERRRLQHVDTVQMDYSDFVD